jgi:hypothetical protein
MKHWLSKDDLRYKGHIEIRIYRITTTSLIPFVVREVYDLRMVRVERIILKTEVNLTSMSFNHSADAVVRDLP